MNDELREKLSAHLDGALSEKDRKDVEERVARDEETRRELEALRAVSSAVKGLPKEELPTGFMARLDARRARQTEPARDWVLLPPAYRPVAAAMSMAVVALVVWDKAHPPVDLPTKNAWTASDDRVAVKTAAEVPTSMDVSGRVATANEPAAALGALGVDKKEAADKLSISPAGRRAAAPGKPIGILEEAPPPLGAAGGAGMATAQSAPAAAAPPNAETSFDKADGAPPSSFRARTEEERSAMNERLYKGFEEEKKRMGIAKIIEKDSADRPARDDSDSMELQSTPEAPSLHRAAAVRGAKAAKSKAKDGGAASVKAIALKSNDALQAAWAGAGLTGEPPAVNFPEQMAVFLAGQPGCGIVSIQNRKKFIVVLYKDSGFESPAARVQAVPLSAKPVVVKPAE